MKLTLLSSLLLGFLACLFNMAQAKTVQNLSQVAGQITNQENLARYEQQMGGRETLPDLGLPLPNGITVRQISTLLAAPSAGYAPTLVGLKPWSAYPDSYIAIICAVAWTETDQQFPSSAECLNPGTEMQDAEIALAVVHKQNDQLTLVSDVLRWHDAQDDPLLASWADSQMPGPIDIDSSVDGNPTLHPRELERFDTANYRLNAQTVAFGIRASTWEGFAGGGASYQTLTLLAIIDGKLRPVLSQPISYLQNFAGEWHEDGTRSHEVNEGNNIVIMLNQPNQAFNALKLKELKGHWTKTFSWDAAQQQYRALQKPKTLSDK